jgi:ABC-2 type transport system permease protein
MSDLGVAWQVARRELSERGKSKAYLLTTVITLVVVVALILLPSIFGGGTDEYDVGSVGEGNTQIIEAGELLANANDEPGAEPSVSITEIEFTNRAEAEAALEAGEVDAVLVDGSEAIVETLGGFGESSILTILQQGAASVRVEELVESEGDIAAVVIAIMASEPLETATLSGQDADDGSKGAIAYFSLLLLYLAILIYGQWILSAVTEEKSNRVVEVLLSTVKPWQLLAGKIAGVGILGLTQFAGTIIVAVLTLQITGAYDIPPVESTQVAQLVLWFVLGFLLYAVLYGAAGSLVSRMEDAQNVAFPMSLIAVVGFFVAITTLSDPDGVAAIVGTFFPLTAPFVVPVRAALDAIPAWQYALSLILTVSAIIGLVFVAGRIYAGGLLRYGGRVKVREAWRSAAE